MSKPFWVIFTTSKKNLGSGYTFFTLREKILGRNTYIFGTSEYIAVHTPYFGTCAPKSGTPGIYQVQFGTSVIYHYFFVKCDSQKLYI